MVLKKQSKWEIKIQRYYLQNDSYDLKMGSSLKTTNRAAEVMEMNEGDHSAMERERLK